MARKRSKVSENALKAKREASASDVETVRVDKWLWAARFFKTRALATAAVTGGHVQINSQRAKPARLIKADDQLLIKKAGLSFTVNVLQISDQRGPAPVARALYQETEESIEQRQAEGEQRRAERLARPDFGFRPDKKSRRERLRFTGKSGD